MPKNSNILIVDDQASVRKLLIKSMQSEGYNVDYAENGHDAIKLAKVKKYHLILLDVVMPGIDGYETCKLIKRNGKSKNSPIIFVTGKNETGANIKGYDAGSVDYLTKPINMNKLTLKVAVHIKSSMLMEKLELYKGRMQADIKKASAFYHAFLPDEERLEYINKTYDIYMDSYFLPYNEIGGDFWKVIDIDQNNFGVLSVDFSGHGIASALNVAYMNAILSHDIKWKDPIKVITFLNNQLKTVLQYGSFATAIYFVFNKKKQTITYVNCAAPYPLLITKSGKDAIFYEESSRPLGIWQSDELGLKSEKIYLNKDETFLICSDVLLESMHKDDGRWMMDGMKKKIIDLNTKPKNRLKELRDLFLKTAESPLSDDLTLISIQSTK